MSNLIKQESANIAIQYTNGRVNAVQKGTPEYNDIFNHCIRVAYLMAVIDEAFEVDGKMYVGDTEIDLGEVYHRLWHYKGQFDIADTDKSEELVEDDGESGCVGGDVAVVSDHYRAGQFAVGIGGAIITFIKDGVPSPLPNANYQVDVRVKSYSGYEQRNLVPTTQYASGFVVEDIVEAGILYYTAQLDT